MGAKSIAAKDWHRHLLEADKVLVETKKKMDELLQEIIDESRERRAKASLSKIAGVTFDV